MIKGLLYLAILTTAVVISWIGFSIYHSNTTSTINSAQAVRITPIPPNFDKAVIDKIRAKKKVNADINQPRVDITLAPEPNSQDVATPSATPVSTSSATTGL